MERALSEIFSFSAQSLNLLFLRLLFMWYFRRVCVIVLRMVCKIYCQKLQYYRWNQKLRDLNSLNYFLNSGVQDSIVLHTGERTHGTLTRGILPF